MRTLETIPRVSLVPEPTPMNHFPRLSATLNGIHVWCKRDDLTYLALGGNKLRKLEFLLRDALDQEADTIITTGATQSNHARLTAAAAASLGLKTVLVLSGPIVGQGQGNLLLDNLLGAEVRFISQDGQQKADHVLGKVAEELRAIGRHPYVIPMGGTNALGVLGYVLAAREIAQQTKEMGIKPKVILCATGSTGTQAGLVLGKHLFDLPFEVIGISVSQPAEKVRSLLTQVTYEAVELIGAKPVPESELTVLDNYVGPGYGVLDETIIEAIRTVASLEGVLLDPVYTGKAMAGLLDLARHGTWKPGEDIIFIHTGGVPALFAHWETLGGTQPSLEEKPDIVPIGP